MSNNPKRDEDKMQEFRSALTSHNTKAPEPEQETGLDRFKAAFGNVADRSTSWVSEQVHSGLQGFVNAVLLGGSSSPELADKHQEQDHEREKEGMDR